MCSAGLRSSKAASDAPAVTRGRNEVGESPRKPDYAGPLGHWKVVGVKWKTIFDQRGRNV